MVKKDKSINKNMAIGFPILVTSNLRVGERITTFFLSIYLTFLAINK